MSLLPVTAALGQNPPAVGDTWPARDYLVKSLVAGIEPILKSQDPATGRFGTKPWLCLDQNVLLPLAAAWALQDANNPWYHNPQLLAAIGKGGEALVDDQDPKGMWIFRKKDNSTWGQIHMPWTYSRWIRAYLLVRDALPPEQKAKWEKGLLLGFTGIRKYADGGVHNIPTHHAMALYIAGVAFGNEDWKQAATRFMAKVVEKQDPVGFWSENFGPVVSYNEVYVDALGVYYSFSKDPVVLEALRRSAKFHSALLWPDGSSVSCVDERVVYHGGIEVGNPGFSWTPEGRGFLIQQLRAYQKDGRLVGADYAANMLLSTGTGEGIAPGAVADQATTVLGNNDILIRREKPWQWAVSGYACPVPTSRWIQDRHNFIDVYQDKLGLVAGGGNTKLQPYWSTFTVGDPTLLKQTPGDENPVFNPKLDLLWVPDSAHIEQAGKASRLTLKYGDLPCTVTTEPQAAGSLRLTYEAPAGKRVEAHLPLLCRGRKLVLADDKIVNLTDEPLALPAGQVGPYFTYANLRVTMPAGATLLWPARQHNPYTKDGSASLSAAKLVLALPFGSVTRYQVDLSVLTPKPFPGLTFEARDMTVIRLNGDVYTKRLDDLGSQLLGGRAVGAALTFALPTVKPGKYELLGDFILASMYGIAQVKVDGKVVGAPFDGYCPDVDAEGLRQSFGAVELGAGTHEITLEMIGKNALSTGYLLSVKRWLLRPL